MWLFFFTLFVQLSGLFASYNDGTTSKHLIFQKGISKSSNGLLLHYMPKQQDIFGCLAKILGCLGLREAAKLEI